MTNEKQDICLRGIDFSVLADVDAREWIGEENDAWEYLVECAAFAHREECEFVVHLPENDHDHAEHTAYMRERGCPAAMVELLDQLQRRGVRWVLLHA